MTLAVATNPIAPDAASARNGRGLPPFTSLSERNRPHA